jgi:glycosyltransferase involved in cell wall biosynthesis
MNKRWLIAWFLTLFVGRQRRKLEPLCGQLALSPLVAWIEYRLRLRQDWNQHSPAKAAFSQELAQLLAGFPRLQKDPALLTAAQQARSEHGLPLFACLVWLASVRLQFRWPFPHRNAAFRAWWQRHAQSIYLDAQKVLDSVDSESQASVSFAERPFGVNLVGHVLGVSGLGEAARMMAMAMQAAQIPFCIRNVPSFNPSSDQDRSFASGLLADDEPLPYAFTIFCMTATTQLEVAVKDGLLPGPHTYTISSWFWETERWPAQLKPAVLLADEFWPCTQLIKTALQPACEEFALPIVLLPPALDLSGVQPELIKASREQTRCAYGLPANAVLFVFSFDLKSYLSRKNPQAVIKAFLLAFGLGGQAGATLDVGLVIKSLPPTSPDPVWDELKATAAADSRVTIVEESLDRVDLLALYQCCDCFVSLHRSEGLGQGPAEALQLGLDVVATNYGGNTDYCEGPLVHPVPYTLVPIGDGEYPYPQNQVWADPDVHAAAAIMQQVACQRRQQPLPEPSIVAAYRSRFAAQRVGLLYKQQLDQLWSQRLTVQATLDRRYASPRRNARISGAATDPQDSQ